ncbi:MAG: fibronectin type III domain-containing protein, partial [Candidatus Moranbacteria bacterium]|nr:fibronectin type III domain-containing protein [Candidatus Moranbacteria bacterium]
MILIIVSVAFFQNSKNAQSATYNWSQSTWSGGQTSNSDVHPGKIGGWNEYASKDSFVQTTNGGDDAELSWTAGSSLQTSDTGGQDTPNAGGFNAGTHLQTKVRGAGNNAHVDLGYSGISAVASGLGHTLLIRSDNTVWAWGENGNGQLGDGTQTARLTPVQIRNSNDNGFLANVEAVAVGNDHSLALGSDGTVWAWGAGNFGQLGDGANGIAQFPTKVKNFDGNGELSGVIAIAAGNGYSLALKDDGTIWAWGSNSKGQLGNGTNVDSNLPVQVSIARQVSIVSSGVDSETTLVVTSDGNVWAWGEGSLGQLGNGTSADSNVPVQVSGISNVTSINGGKNRSVALKQDKSVWAWGNNSSGELGDGTNDASNVPVQVSNLTGISSISGGSDHSLAIKTNGTIWAWGNNNKGQLGDGTFSNRSMPVAVSNVGANNSVMVAGGQSFSVALKLDGSVWAWGWNYNGRLGNNDGIDKTNPVQVWNPAQGIFSGFIDVYSGYSHNLGLKADGTVWAWGKNGFGQLGDGTNINRLTPVQVVGLTNVTAISAGYNHSLALKSDGTVWAWGWNFYGQLGDGTQASQSFPVQVKASNTPGDYLQNVSAISVGDTHSMALKNDGTLWSWGGNLRGQLGVGSITFYQPYPVQTKDQTGTGFLSNVTSISGGGYYSLVSLGDGTAWSWGANEQGQLGDGDTGKSDTNLPVQVKSSMSENIANVAKVSAGYAHALALLNDGSLMSWGWNDYGQLGIGNINLQILAQPVIGAGTSGVENIKAGNTHNVMKKTDGTVWTWGNNGSGQLADANTSEVKNSPIQVGGGASSNVAIVSCGEKHSLALSTDGSVWNWGDNGNGQLGQNNNKSSIAPVQLIGASGGVIDAGHTSYFTSGTSQFTSAVVDSGSIKTYTTLDFSTTKPAGTSVSIDVKAGNTSVPDGSWISLSNVASGGDITALGQKRYYQYVATMTTSDSNITPSFNDITFHYEYFPSPGHLVSSPYDTSDASNILSKIRWSETLATGTSVQFQVRTATDKAGLASASWMGPDGTSNTYFADKTGAEAMPSAVSDGVGDQWVQYQALLISDGLNSPTLQDVTLQYVVNAPPEVQNVVALQDGNGIVNVTYDVRDPDSAVPQNVTPGKVIVGLQYCTANCGVAGNEVWADASTLSGDVGPNIAVQETNWNSYQLSWNAKSDYPEAFNGSNFKVRIKTNDSEGANNLGYGKSGNFVFDTKNPTNVGFAIDHTANKLHVKVPVDDSSYQMIVSNLADFSDATYENFQADYDYAGLTNDPATVHLRIKDAHGNYTDAVETTPVKLSDVVYYDISNPATNEYRELISWKAPSAGQMGSGGFAKYNIWRSTDGIIYSLVNSITDKNVNYYLDSNLSTGTSYSYKITLEDADGNVSAFSNIVNDVPDGEGGANATPPVISNVQAPIISVTSNSAIVTWDTDVVSNSTVGYSTTPGDFSNEVGSATLVDAGHSVTITELNQNTQYYFRVKSAGVNNIVDINDNFDTSGNHDGYTFTTASADVVPPVISNLSSAPTTTSAAISWSTNEAATSFVEYSTTQGFSVGSSYGSYDLVLSHNITLPSILSPGTVYYYKVHSKDGAGNEIVSSEASFQTVSLGDVTAPIINTTDHPVQATAITHKTATIIWQTDESATSYVEYGTTTSYGKIFGNSNLVSGPPYDHSISLPQDLVPDTTYNYRVHSADAAGNAAVSGNFTFKTAVDPQDVVVPTLQSGPAVTATSSTSATITWVTNENATSFVDYSPTVGNFQMEQGSSVLTQTHSVTLVNLNPDTQYFYQLKSADASGNTLTVNNGGNGFSFVTASGQPPILQGAPFAAKNSYDAFTISWTTDVNSTSFVEYATLSDFSNSVVFGKYDNVKNHSISLNFLSPATTYYYRVRSAAQFEMVSGSYSFATDQVPVGPDVTAPTVSNVSLLNVTDNGATVTWNTNENADSVVYVGTSTNYDLIFGNNAASTTTHSVNISGLQPSSTYNYQIVSKDGSGNVTYGTSQNFTTLAAAGAPVLSNIQASVQTDTKIPATYNQVTITWDSDVAGDSKVLFSKDDSLDKSIFHPADLIAAGHSITISDLAYDTTYNYEVLTKATNNAITTSSKKTFTTAKDPQYLHDPLKKIDNVVSSTTTNSAAVTFTTDQSAKCSIEYRPDGQVYSAGLSAESDFNINHRVQLLSLISASKYFFKISCADNLGTAPIFDTEYSFATNEISTSNNGNESDKVLPVIKNVQAGKATGESVIVTWNTDKKTSSYVRYGTTSTFGSMMGNDSVNVDQAKYDTVHTVTLNGLVPATKYFYSVVSVDLSGNIAESSAGNFTTATQSTLNSISIVSKVLGEATVTWITDKSMTSTVEYGLTNNYGSESNSKS